MGSKEKEYKYVLLTNRWAPSTYRLLKVSKSSNKKARRKTCKAKLIFRKIKLYLKKNRKQNL